MACGEKGEQLPVAEGQALHDGMCSSAPLRLLVSLLLSNFDSLRVPLPSLIPSHMKSWGSNPSELQLEFELCWQRVSVAFGRSVSFRRQIALHNQTLCPQFLRAMKPQFRARGKGSQLSLSLYDNSLYTEGFGLSLGNKIV